MPTTGGGMEIENDRVRGSRRWRVRGWYGWRSVRRGRAVAKGTHHFGEHSIMGRTQDGDPLPRRIAEIEEDSALDRWQDEKLGG